MLMKRFGPFIGLLLFAVIILGAAHLPSSCSSMTPAQQARLQAVAVPAASLGLHIAQSRGYIEPGDRVLIQRGVAVLTSGDDTEAKLFRLAELGIEHAMKQGVVKDGDLIELQDADVALISSEPPPQVAPPLEPVTPLNLSGPSPQPVAK